MEFINSPAISSFIAAREKLQIYCLKPFVGAKREIAVSVLKDLELYISTPHLSTDEELINSELKENITLSRKKGSSSEYRERLSDLEYFLQNAPASASEFKFSCFLVCSCISGDFFAADNAYRYLKECFGPQIRLPVVNCLTILHRIFHSAIKTTRRTNLNRILSIL